MKKSIEDPVKSCFPGGGTWPTCLNNLNKPKVKQRIAELVNAGEITQAQIEALANEASLTEATRTAINEYLNGQ